MRNTRNYLDVHSVVDGPYVPPTPPTSPAPVTYEVILPEGAGYTAAFVAGSSSPAVAGSTVNFTVVTDEGYGITLVTVNGGHTLTAVNGVYTINAIAADTTISVDAILAPVAGFTCEADTDNPLTIEFTNTSTNAVSYRWNFGDGSSADLTANPNHTYEAPGTYTVVLTAINIVGVPDTEIKNITVL